MSDRCGQQLIAAGEFKSAAEWLDGRNTNSQTDRILKSHIELEIGDTEKARLFAESLLRENLETKTRAQCLSLMGRALGRLGAVREAISYQRKAVALAAACDPSLECEILGALVSGLLNWIGIEPALAEMPRLKRGCLATSNKRALVEYHLANARIATMRGLLQRAERESRMASDLLDASPHVIQLWKLRQIQSNVAIKACDLESAQRHAEECLRLAERSGSKLSTGATLGNLAHIATLAGHFEVGRTLLARAMKLLDPASHLQIAAFSTGLELGSLSGDDAFADLMVSQRDSMKQAQQDSPYYGLWFELNRVKWLIAKRRFAEAAQTAMGSVEAIEKLADSDLLDRMTLLAAEALAQTGNQADATTLLENVCIKFDGTHIETLAECNRVAAVLVSCSREGSPVGYLNRASRLLTAAGLLGTRTEVIRTAADLRVELRTGVKASDDGRLDGLESIATALQLGKHPRLLGVEIVALLQALGLCDDAAVGELVRGQFIALTTPDQLRTRRLHHRRTLILGIGTDQGRDLVVRTRANKTGARAMISASVAQIVKSAQAVAAHRISCEEEVVLWPIESPVHQHGMVVASENMVELVTTTRRLAPSTITVLITGETGTGKELLARALHDASPRKDRPFIPFNCSAVSREMLDAQLFGYRRGAFTGAQEAFPGVVRAAAGGTLFLDEIGEISLDVQPKLLRFLESGEIHPLGEPKPIIVDVRIVTATNANLEQLVADGKFREDLFYRLNVVRLDVPPLRERREEIPLLVQHFLEKYSRESSKSGLRLAEETMEYLILYKWPGNVRRLANEVRRLVALAESGAVLMPEHLSPDIAASRRTVPASERDLAPTEFVVRMDQPMSAAIEHLERSMIQYAFKLSTGVEDAAQTLGLSRKGLYLKRLRLGLGDIAANGGRNGGRDSSPGHSGTMHDVR